jgi:hypothetical protein
MRQNGLSGPVDFYFDDMHHTTYMEIYRMWHLRKKHLPAWYRRRLGQLHPPMDDKSTLPLQAADLFSWLYRRHYQETADGIPEDQMVSVSLAKTRFDMPLAFAEYDEEQLLLIRDRMKASLAMQERITGRSFVYETGKARSERIRRRTFPFE